MAFANANVRFVWKKQKKQSLNIYKESQKLIEKELSLEEIEQDIKALSKNMK